MCLIIKEDIKFPFLELKNVPDGRGKITLHIDGTWTWTTVYGLDDVEYGVYKSEGKFCVWQNFLGTVVRAKGEAV